MRTAKEKTRAPFAAFVFQRFSCCNVYWVLIMPRPSKYQLEKLSYNIIGACIDVQRQLGVHCMEVDYQRALEMALPKFGVEFEREVEIPIVYDGAVVTKRRVDFVCWNKTDECLLETKAASTIRPEDSEQCLLYVSKANLKLVLTVNFGEKPVKVRRFVNTPEGGKELL